MTLNAGRKLAHDRLAALPGVSSIRRPVTRGGAELFDLYYVRTGPPSDCPLVVIPGGPGVASISMYRGLRERAADLDLDVVMVEHRGVGMSRHDDAGADLPPAAITVDQVVEDIAAVLDDIGVAAATVYGTSYGTYLAAGLGVRHPHRVHAMVLDSPVLCAQDLEAIRAAVRGLLLDGAQPGAQPGSPDIAAKVRRLVDSGAFDALSGEVAATAYAFGGAPLLSRLLDLLLSGHTLLWRAMTQIGRLSLRKIPYHNEVDLVGRIAFRELDYAGEPDGLPLDPAEALVRVAEQIPGPRPVFEGEPYDLVAEMPRFGWPTLVISGQRDLTTPPAVAQRVADLIPGAVLLRLPTAAHSILDTRETAALRIARSVVDGDIDGLPAEADELDGLPGNTSVRLLVSLIEAAAVVEKRIPGAKPIS